MGFWPSFWSSPSPPKPKISADGTPIAPGRSERSKCWEARDEYFKCLDRIEVIDSITEKGKAENGCGVEGRGFEDNCASSWVIYFKKRRVMEHKKAEKIKQLQAEGIEGLPEINESSARGPR